MSTTIEPVCGALGCSNDADVVVYHQSHGKRVVCSEHVDDREVVDDV